jgi:hypothetical protein
MIGALDELRPYLLLILVGFLPNELWRWLGVWFARGLDESADIIVWVRAVATAVLAGVIARLIVLPPAALGSVPFGVRIAAIAVGFLAFLLVRRSIFVGILTGEIALVVGALIASP